MGQSVNEMCKQLETSLTSRSDSKWVTKQQRQLYTCSFSSLKSAYGKHTSLYSYFFGPFQVRTIKSSLYPGTRRQHLSGIKNNTKAIRTRDVLPHIYIYIFFFANKIRCWYVKSSSLQLFFLCKLQLSTKWFKSVFY